MEEMLLSIQSAVELPTFEAKNTTRHYHNHMRVAETSYPYFFQQAMTYSFGNEKIIGIGRLTMPISQDTYGFYSLVVFCSDGVFTLGVNRTGDGAYTNTTYSSPEICSGRQTICEIGGALFFASDKGLLALTSQDTGKLYAEHLNGEVGMLPPENVTFAKSGEAIYKKILESPNILSYTDMFGTHLYTEFISTDDFVDYLNHKDQNTGLSDTCVRYVSNKNKLVIYNSSYNYVYFIDIPTGNTTKLPMRIDFDNGDFPNKVFWTRRIKNGVKFLMRHTFGYTSEDTSVPCLIQSRPIKVLSDDKTAYRFVITGKFSGEEGQWAELVVMHSLDADNWHILGIKEMQLDNKFHNIGCVTDRTSWKYLMFVFAGRLNKGSRIDSIDVTVNGKYRNKKR